jgi:hypothetical protein
MVVSFYRSTRPYIPSLVLIYIVFLPAWNCKASSVCKKIFPWARPTRRKDCQQSISETETNLSTTLTSVELHNLYSPTSIIRIIKSKRMRWPRYVEQVENRNVYRMLVGKPEGKRSLGRPRRRWVDNIKMDLKRDWMGWCGLDWSASG